MDELKKLQDFINECVKDKTLSSSSSYAFLEKLQSKISKSLGTYFSILFLRKKAFFERNFRKNYLKYVNKEMLKNNASLKSYKLNDLKPTFKEIYKKRLMQSLLLIKTQNSENMNKLANRFYNWVNLETTQGNKETLRQFTKLPKDKWIKFILRDQSNKMTASFDEIIADKYEAIAFQWKTRDDNRVVGKPSGLYPKPTNPLMHGDHYIRRDKWFFYPNNWALKQGLIKKEAFVSASDEIKDGMPSTPIGCRCYAYNVYLLSDLPTSLLTKKGKEYLKANPNN